MTGLPYPTPHRLRLADAIAAGQVTHYHWINPWSCDTARNANVSARVAELVAAKLAEIPAPPDEIPESLVRLTPDGMAWVTRARTREPVSEEAMDAALVAVFNDLGENGPVSTSPETGPPASMQREVDFDTTPVADGTPTRWVDAPEERSEERWPPNEFPCEGAEFGVCGGAPHVEDCPSFAGRTEGGA